MKALLVPGFLLALVTAAPLRAGDPVYPGSDWQTASPESMGFDPVLFQAALNSINGNLAVVREGYLVGQRGNIGEGQLLYSVSKALTSTVFGTLLQSGQVGLDDLVPFSDNPSAPLASYRQFLNMTSDYGLTPHDPGNHHAYNNKAVHHYGWAMEPLFNDLDPAGILDQAVFSVIGRQDVLEYRGLWSGWGGGFTLSARDSARVGYLILRRGEWTGQQVLPREFVSDFYQNQIPEHSTPSDSIGSPPTEGPPGNNWWNQDHLTALLPGNFSYGWWTNAGDLYPTLPRETIFATGLGGHLIIVCPRHDIVVTVVAGGATQTPEQVLRPILNAIVTNPRDPNGLSQGGEITGELKQWHKVTLTLDGPPAAETDAVNPFLDYRMNVTFSRGSRSFVVPGYFAADGDAAETGATAGQRWRAHCVPDETGLWSYQVSFRAGAGIAVSGNPNAGAPVAPDGASGFFTVTASDKTGVDFRGKGLLRYVGERYLRFAGTGEAFLKGGANSPENLLAYAGFDQTPNSHYYQPHVADWQPGDLDWRGGQGRGLIGALNYLSSTGMNTVFFLTMNVDGDGDDVWPWTSMFGPLRYDCSKLDQWELVFEQMDRLGLQLHVVTQETENDQMLDGGALGVERKLYYRELVARFSHHLALLWNLGEENTNLDSERKQFADYLRALDPYDHPITVHTELGAQQAVYGPLLGYPSIESASLQVGLVNETHDETLTWAVASAAYARPWVVCLDEIGPSSIGVVPDAIDAQHDDMRREGLWGNLMAGGAGAEWYFGYFYPDHDLTCEDWRSRAQMWRLTDLALDFFRTYLPFTEMLPFDPLVSGAAGAHCLAKSEEVLAAYLPSGGAPSINLSAFPGVYSVEWFDPRGGGPLQVTGSRFVAGGSWVQVGGPPADPGEDWVLLLRRVGQYQQLYGTGLAGDRGLTPATLASSAFVGNPSFMVHLAWGRPQTLGLMVAGSQMGAYPAFGGTLLNNHAYGAFLVATNAQGKSLFQFPIPNRPSLAGRNVYFQWLLNDPSAIGGVSMSRGLRATFH